MKQPLLRRVRAFLCLMLCSSVLFDAAAQKATLSPAETLESVDAVRQQQSLLGVLRDLEESYQVNFAYQKKHLNGKYVQTQRGDCEQLEACLTQLLEPLNLTYKKVKNVYVIQPQEKATPQSGANPD